MDNAPAAKIGSGGDGGVGGEDDRPLESAPIVSHVVGATVSGRKEGAGDNAHRFLRVVAPVTDAVGCGGKQLEPAKPGVDRAWRRVTHQPVARRSEQQSQGQPDHWRDYDEDEGLGPTGGDDDGESAADAVV